MNRPKLAALFISGLLGIASAGAANHHGQAPTQPKEPVVSDNGNEATPRLTLLTPRADILKGGYIYLPFRVDNMTILPLYNEIHGEEATKLRPRIGHLHVIVDNNKWSWIHAQPDPLYYGPFPSGPHNIKIELADASHKVIETKTLKVEIP